MCFVGRKREISRILASLEQGNNVVISGKYGIGRTALIKHIARHAPDGWKFFFLDFSKTPGEVCDALLKKTWCDDKPSHKRTKPGYKASRFRIAHRDPAGTSRQVLVLDNIAKLSRQKLTLLGHLSAEKRFGFIAIVEHFLPAEDLLRLRTVLSPALFISLSGLSMRHVQEFLRNCSIQYKLDWTENRIRTLSSISGGYPLGMRALVDEKRNRA